MRVFPKANGLDAIRPVQRRFREKHSINSPPISWRETGCRLLVRQLCQGGNDMSAEIRCDLFEWMPGYGENSIATSFDGSTFCIDVRYDGGQGEELKKTLYFYGTSYHSVGSFPGVGVLEKAFSYRDGEFRSGAVKVLKESELADEWREYWTKSNIPSLAACDHYLIFFTSENKVIHVIAKDFLVK